MPTIPLNELKAEIDHDPTGLGLPAMRDAGSDALIASTLNEVQSDIQIEIRLLWSYEMVAQIVPSEYDAVATQLRQRLDMTLGTQRVDIRSPHVRRTLLDAFPAGSTSRANMAALQKRNGSRAEELWGEEAAVTANDVAAAYGRG